MSDTIIIGKIVNVFGIRGEVKIYNYSGFDDRYENLDRILVDGKPYPIREVRHHKGMILLKLEGVDTRNDAERLRGKNVCMTEDDLLPLEEGEHYIRNMIGMEVVDQTRGRIGILKDVLTDRPQNIFVVKLDQGGECLIPWVSAFVLDVDEERNRADVNLIEGMI